MKKSNKGKPALTKHKAAAGHGDRFSATKNKIRRCRFPVVTASGAVAPDAT